VKVAVYDDEILVSWMASFQSSTPERMNGRMRTREMKRKSEADPSF
jgi:hypothetical protein